MKKVFTLFSLVAVYVSCFSQISFLLSDIPAAVSNQRIAIDTFPLPTVNFGSKGTNQSYDFSNLVLYKYDTVEFRTPTNSQITTCPNADVATTADGINFILTNTDNANNKLTLEGFEGLISGNVLSAAYSTKPDIYRLPMNYQSNFNGTGYLQKTVPGSQVGQPLATSVELTITTTYTDTVDGWGKVKTPVGTYKCLRNQRKETTTTLIRALIFGTWSTISNTTATNTRYTYLTKEAKGSVVTFNYDTANVLQSVNWAMTPPTAPVADFSFVVGTNGSVAFTDLSDFYPTSWSWNFGDGSAVSTQQNPTHVYAANGNYNVCLIATNAGGSSTQVCKQVSITNIPLAPVAAFTWVNTSGGLVDFTDQSTNTPTSWSWNFGDASALSSLQNPSHVYTANNTYNVCLTATNAGGSNQYCENVVVTGITASNNAPVAADDTASVLQPNGLTVNVAANDIDPDSDPLCITAVYGSAHFTVANCSSVLYSPDSTYVGADSCYYIICDNGSPVKCDTAKLVVNSLFNSALLPVARFTWSQHSGCDAGTFINTSTNGTGTVNWNFYSVNQNQNQPLTGDTLLYNDASGEANDVIVTISVSNQFGTDNYVDTVTLLCLSISEISLSNISLYPNPATNLLTIDMSNNNDALINNYAAIEIYNSIGETVKVVTEKNKKIVNISVAEFTEGMYLATLIDANGIRKTLGKFTVVK